MSVGTLTRRAFTAGAGGVALLACGERSSGAVQLPAVRRLLEAYVADGRLAGVSCIAGVRDARVRINAGRLSLDPKSPAMDERSICRIYSMTKPVTALAALILIEEGRLSLDMPLADILPAFTSPAILTETGATPARTPITIRHLLTHTAGFGYVVLSGDVLTPLYRRSGVFAVGPDPMRALPDDGPEPQSLREFGDRLAALPLAREPGTAWSYSVASDVLGLVIQQVSGESFESFLQNRVFAPLDMVDTGFYVPAQKSGRLAWSYRVTADGLEIADAGPDSPFTRPHPVLYGGAGLVSTARDYARFCMMLLNGGTLGAVRIVRPATAALFHTNLLPRGLDGVGELGGNGFGAGGYVVTNAAGYGAEPLGCLGWSGAAGTLFWVDPASRVFCVLMTQFSPFTAYSIHDELKAALYADLSGA